jgi:CheY-like chemotaxis protein/HPt (histidine-containing phosphotransfer) domain-containing protein
MPRLRQTERREISRFHVLLIEDHPVMRQLVSVALEPLALQLHGCASVRQARTWLDVHGAPDLLLTDLMLPGETGLDFLSELRAGPDWQQTLPVLVLTAGVQPEVMQELGSLNVRQVLIKPVDIDVLCNAVKTALQANPSMPAKTAVEARFGGDADMFETFLAAALAQFPVDSRQIDEALAGGDVGALERGAHSIKGVFALLREDVASEVARRLEWAAREGRSDDATAIWAVLRAWLDWYVVSQGGQAAQGPSPSLYLAAS